MHHKIYLTACVLGVAYLAAAATSTLTLTVTLIPTSTSTAEDATISKQSLFDSKQVNFCTRGGFWLIGMAVTLIIHLQIATFESKLRQFKASHTADDEFVAYQKFRAEKTTGPLADVNEGQFNDQLKHIKDVDVAAFVTALPSSIQSYMRSYYAGKASIVDEIRAAETPVKTAGESASSDKRTTGTHKTSTGTVTKTMIVTVSEGPARPAPTPSTTLSSSSIIAANDTTSPTSSSSTPNAASQPTGVLKAAGAVAVGLVGLIILV